jgi:precorrin-2 dehydrogenase/sirohydrochlorin ferrochelatase
MERNELYPVFLKLHTSVLIVGGGNVGLEKTVFLVEIKSNAMLRL